MESLSRFWEKLWSWTDYRPRPLDDIFETLRERIRIQVQEKEGVRVETAVLNARESSEIFKSSLAVRGIQPVWIKIRNTTDEPVWFLPLYIDSEYYAPLEAAFLNHWMFFRKRNRDMDRFFRDVHLREYVPAKSEVSGIVFTHCDSGLKIVNIELLKLTKQLLSFLFFVQVGDMRHDYSVLVDPSIPPKPGEAKNLESYEELRKVLEGLPQYVTNRKGKGQGDPLNFAFVGTANEVIGTLTHQGWDETELIYYGSITKTIRSYLRKSPYRYSPISSLYVFDRRQDFALQKARKSIVQRNHLRVWKTAYTFRNRVLWVGQISRDIGVRLTTKTLNLTTHVIDPDVDESRNYLIQDVIASGRISKIGFVEAVGKSDAQTPRTNLTGDPFFTDGLRVLFVLSEEEHPGGSWDILPWVRLRDHV